MSPSSKVRKWIIEAGTSVLISCQDLRKSTSVPKMQGWTFISEAATMGGSIWWKALSLAAMATLLIAVALLHGPGQTELKSREAHPNVGILANKLQSDEAELAQYVQSQAKQATASKKRAAVSLATASRRRPVPSRFTTRWFTPRSLGCMPLKGDPASSSTLTAARVAGLWAGAAGSCARLPSDASGGAAEQRACASHAGAAGGSRHQGGDGESQEPAQPRAGGEARQRCGQGGRCAGQGEEQPPRGPPLRPPDSNPSLTSLCVLTINR